MAWTGTVERWNILEAAGSAPHERVHVHTAVAVRSLLPVCIRKSTPGDYTVCMWLTVSVQLAVA